MKTLIFTHFIKRPFFFTAINRDLLFFFHLKLLHYTKKSAYTTKCCFLKHMIPTNILYVIIGG